MTSSTERPFVMTVPMVKAILSGQNTQARVPLPGEPWQEKLEERSEPEEWRIATPGNHRHSSTFKQLAWV